MKRLVLLLTVVLLLAVSQNLQAQDVYSPWTASLSTNAINNPVGEVGYDVARFKKTVELAAEKSNWDNKVDDVYLGMSAYYSHNSYVAEVAEVVMIDGNPKLQKVYCATDCGIVVNPDGAKHMIQGGVIDGIGHAMYADFSVKDGKPSIR